MTHSYTVANEFIRLSLEDGNPLTNMQIQKLVYFAHIIYAVKHDGNRLIAEDWFAWTFGPVEKNLYESLRTYGPSPVTVPIEPISRNKGDHLAEKEKDVIRKVYKGYGKYTAFQLSELTHLKGGPWYKTWFGHGKFQVIPHQLIYDFYSSKLKSA